MSRVVAATLGDKVLRCLDRVAATLDGLDAAQASWRPLPGANSVGGIAGHVFANVEENVLAVMPGLPAGRDRRGEFDAQPPDALLERWTALRPRLAAAFDAVDDGALLRDCEHPRRGRITVAELLVVVRGHAGEHEGEAALTRALVLARRA